MPDRHVLVNMAAIFRSEVAAARVLGFKLRIATNPPEHTALVQLVPLRDNIRAQIITRRQGEHATGIESKVHVAHEDERLDCTREAIRAALDLAKDAGA